jgi:two-component system phosphate regulon sensor histidine kinase PhoR
LHHEVDELAELVRELLELSRIESGSASLRPLPVDPVALLREAVERLRPMAERSELTLKLELGGDLPRVQADGERVKQILANLLHNAIKFTPAGGSVTLRAGRAAGGRSGGRTRWAPANESGREELEIAIADTGIGIPPDDLTRVFERFYKTDRSRSSGGTGLGLAIAKHLVQAHGGRIWAEHNSPRGSVFCFTLPVETVAQANVSTESRPAAERQSSSAPARG